MIKQRGDIMSAGDDEFGTILLSKNGMTATLRTVGAKSAGGESVVMDRAEAIEFFEKALGAVAGVML